MVEVRDKAPVVAELLGKLESICDSGFALAVHIRYTRPALLYQTYSRDWTDFYSEKGFMLSDPTVLWGLANIGSIDWDKFATLDPEGIITAAGTYGLHNRWTYSVGPATSRSLASMTRTSGFTEDQRAAIRATIDEIHAETEGFEHFPAKVQDALRALP